MMTQTAAAHYRIQPLDPGAHLFEVSCIVPSPDPGGQRLSLPVWIPGSYMVREFARHIVRIDAAAAAGQAVALTKLDKATWQAAPCVGPLEVRYQVYAWDLSVRGAHLDTTHGYFNGPCVFLRVHGAEEQPCTVAIEPPAGIDGWRLATSLSRAGAPLYGFGQYQAADYDDLIDHPVEMGRFDLVSFEAGGVPHDVVISGRHRADLSRLRDDLARVCNAQCAMFGGLPPLERYVFLVTVVDEGYGGLEHRASTSLLCSRNDLPLAGRVETTEEYRTFLGLCSHEYFHTWNVKRIKPAAFVPYDLTRENYTRQLWAFEGITSYYDDLMLARAGLITAEQYLETVAQTVTRVLRGSGRLVQSVAESSFDAWTKFYRQEENAPNAIVSYYAKGSLIALALDLLMCRHSGGVHSLDDLMRRLWREYGQTGIGVPEGRIEALASELAGQDLTDFFARVLYGTEDVPLAEVLGDVGVAMCLRAAESAQDKGGKPAKKTSRTRPVLGVRVVAENGGAKLANVFSGGAAERAGLAANDVVVALDGLRVNGANLEKMVEGYQVGDRLRVHAFRRDELMEFEAVLQAAPADTCELTLIEEIDAATRARREHWLGTMEAPS